MVLRLTGSDLRKTTIKVQSDTPFMAYCIIGPTESYTRMALYIYNLYIILVPKNSDVRHFLLLTSNMLGQIQIEDEIIPESDWLERNPLGPHHETGLVDVSNMSDTMYVRAGADSMLFICFVLGLAHPPQGFYIFPADTTKIKLEMDLEELLKTKQTAASEVLFEASDYQFECPSGFYGPECMTTCNCGDEFCNRDGSCYSASCRRGSFGPRCLLEDISVYALNSTPHELFDGDPATCVTPSDNRIDVELFDVFHTSSVTVVLKTSESVPVSSFEVLLENKTDSYQAILKTTIDTDTAVDLVFADLKAFKKMTVSLKQQLQICSFHISGGINFLRKIDPNFAVVSFPMEDITVNEEYLKAVTDGDRYKTCIGATGSTRFGLQTKDMIPKLFYKVAIYTDNETAFELIYKTETNFDYKVNLVVKPKRAGIIQLNRLVIFLTLQTKSTQFSICEIEIYTDIAAFDSELSKSDTSKDEISDSPFLYIGVAVFFVVLVVAFVCYRKRSTRRDYVDE
ncbi:uncharacterized protein LOC131939364 [Physella acuta]|uniref:uncharacterized protein LOC131939364 n=1 Tax=Physella acuta TaxID=109671 RepID=UPI0027DC4002|nr:uncharacterized protein LOC131939364 [Physella acuta]